MTLISARFFSVQGPVSCLECNAVVSSTEQRQHRSDGDRMQMIDGRHTHGKAEHGGTVNPDQNVEHRQKHTILSTPIKYTF